MLERTPLPHVSTTADELTTLTGFLDHYRAVFIRKVEGLDDEQARLRVAASTLDLLGLTRHMADVECWWFRRMFADETEQLPYGTDDDPDRDFHHEPADTIAAACAAWHREVWRAREIVIAADDLGSIAARVSERRGPISLRWILVHMIEEYARHCGHADLLREVIDGTVDD